MFNWGRHDGFGGRGGFGAMGPVNFSPWTQAFNRIGPTDNPELTRADPFRRPYNPMQPGMPYGFPPDLSRMTGQVTGTPGERDYWLYLQDAMRERGYPTAGPEPVRRQSPQGPEGTGPAATQQGLGAGNNDMMNLISFIFGRRPPVQAIGDSQAPRGYGQMPGGSPQAYMTQEYTGPESVPEQPRLPGPYAYYGGFGGPPGFGGQAGFGGLGDLMSLLQYMYRSPLAFR
jgi:hypothetical protein